MAQVSIRNLPEDVLERLRGRARANGRSLEAELRAILEQAALLSREEFWELADAIAAEIGPVGGADTTELIREGRDR